MPIAVYTRLEGDVGRCPTPRQGERACGPQRTENGACRPEGANLPRLQRTERPVGATGEASERRPYAGPQDCRPPEYWDGATCGDCKFFDPKTETCGGNPDSPTIAGLPADWCFLWEPRRAEP